MNPCEDVQPLISAELDGELDAAQRHMVDEHLAVCAGCHEQRDALAQVNQLLTAPRVHSSPRFRGQVLTAVSRRRWRTIGWQLALAASAAVVLLALGLSLASRSPTEVAQPLAGPLAEPLATLRLIHCLHNSAHRSSLRACEWDLRAMKLELDRMELEPAHEQELAVRIELLMRRIREAEQLSSNLETGA